MPVTSGNPVQLGDGYQLNVTTSKETGLVIARTEVWSKSPARQVAWQRVTNTTPGYRNLVKQGKFLPMQPFLWRSVTTHGPRIVGQIRQETEDTFNKRLDLAFGFRSDRFVVGLPDINPSAKVLDALDQRAVNKVLLKAKDQKVNLVQAAAERKQTANMFAANAERIAKALGKLAQKDLLGAAKELGSYRRSYGPAHRRLAMSKGKIAERQFSSAWLELQYGWMPLVSDVFGSAEKIAQQDVRELRARVSASSTTKVLRNDLDDARKEGLTYTTRNVVEIDAEVKYVLHFTATDPEVQTLTSLGITNPALIAWELMPWSFVIDWFIPIGNWISSWDATVGLTFKAGTKTTVISSNGSALRTFYKDSKSPQIVGQSTISGELVDVNRQVLTSFPRVGIPSFKSPVSVTHAINALALLVARKK